MWQSTLRNAALQMQGRNVQITSVPLPTLYADSKVLSLILSEYLNNALKFTRTRQDTRLRLHVQETATEYHIGLEDNGVGFNMRQKDKMFALFGKLHAGNDEGIGLGLAVVRRVCERFGGRAWGEGKVGQGATFWFAWPKQSGEPK